MCFAGHSTNYMKRFFFEAQVGLNKNLKLRGFFISLLFSFLGQRQFDGDAGAHHDVLQH